MNRMPSIAIRVAVAAIILFFGMRRMQAQEPASTPTKHGSAKQEAPKQEPAKQGANKEEKDEEEENPFAPQPAAPLPAGMTGSDVNDSRFNLTPGMYDAGEASMGIKHLLLLKKPDAFELGASDPNAPKVNETLKTVLGVADPSKMPPPTKLVLAGLGFANSDIAFQGNRLFLGNFYGVNIYDISNP